MNSAAASETRHSQTPRWKFRIYIAGHTRKSLQVLENLDRFCKTNLPGQYEIEIVDVFAKPRVALTENIIALPTVVKIAPNPACRLIGTCSETDQLLRVLKSE
jgi:circadian clock protein KaiB